MRSFSLHRESNTLSDSYCTKSHNMERNPAVLFLILLLLIISSGPRASETSTDPGTGRSISKVIHVDQELSWDSAQDYCREHHSDLVTIRNAEEAAQILSYEGWIGLHRTNESWMWSHGDEEATFTLWKDDSDDNKKNCAVKYEMCNVWEAKECKEAYPFICYEEVVLVEEMKSWEEALVHCRERLSPVGDYDLISKPKDDTEIPYRDIEVWVGLRFLAGEWWWINGQEPNNADLPSCPAQQQFCGALESNHMMVMIRNCGEKRFFLCSRNQHL